MRNDRYDDAGYGMNPKIDEIIARIKDLELNLSAEIELQEAKLVEEFHESQTHLRQTLLSYITQAPLLFIITAPIIYAGMIPALFLEVFLWLYQGINFRVYGIDPVSRKEYFVYDRAKLSYLNIIEKINCLYCLYFNGLMAYASEVAGRTEQFWCPIRHARKTLARHRNYSSFIPYGDAIRYRQELESLRKALQEERDQ